MDQKLEDAILLLRGALRAAAWDDLAQAEMLVNDARLACVEWLALSRSRGGRGQEPVPAESGGGSSTTP